MGAHDKFGSLVFEEGEAEIARVSSRRICDSAPVLIAQERANFLKGCCFAMKRLPPVGVSFGVLCSALYGGIWAP